jgi:methylated-DNA-protein-cysteine methyltransferase-like protein
MKKKKVTGKTFSERVVEAALSIPKGRVTTYGRLSRACGGGAMASQSITGILAKAYNEKTCKIPFHRIVYADGKIWTSEEYHAKRMKLYKEEGIEVAILKHKNLVENNNFRSSSVYKIKNFEDIVFDFN